MLRRVLLLLSLAALPGCACLDRPYEPLSDCCASWDPILGGGGSCGVCQGDCEGHTPGSYLKYQLTCGAGCGDVYWGEWISDPPDDCDPCDDCGNWIGPTCCPPTFMEQVASGWLSLWGSRVGCGVADCAECGAVPVKGGGLMKSAPLMTATESPVHKLTSRSLFRSARFQQAAPE